MVSIFVRRLTGDLTSLVKQIDGIVKQNSDKRMAAFLVLLSEDAESAERDLKALADKQSILHVPLTIFDGKAGPPQYQIAEDAEVTVMMWGGEKKLVRVNHAFRKGQLDKASIAKIVADTAKILR